MPDHFNADLNPDRLEIEDLILDVFASARTHALSTLEHDPYNVDAIKLLLEGGWIYGVRNFDPEDEIAQANERNLAARLTVARPFHWESWMDAGRLQARREDDYETGRAFPFFQNAVFYSGHDLHTIEWMLDYVLDRVFIKHIIESEGDFELNQELRTTPELACPAVRLNRLATHACRSSGQGAETCPAILAMKPGSGLLMSLIDESELCPAEATAPISALRFQPQQIVLDDLTVPLDGDME